MRVQARREEPPILGEHEAVHDDRGLHLVRVGGVAASRGPHDAPQADDAAAPRDVAASEQPADAVRLVGCGGRDGPSTSWWMVPCRCGADPGSARRHHARPALTGDQGPRQQAVGPRGAVSGVRLRRSRLRGQGRPSLSLAAACARVAPEVDRARRTAMRGRRQAAAAGAPASPNVMAHACALVDAARTASRWRRDGESVLRPAGRGTGRLRAPSGSPLPGAMARETA